jgi:hypothetical protein
MGCSVEEHMNENRKMCKTISEKNLGIRLRMYVSGGIFCPYSGVISPARVAHLGSSVLVFVISICSMFFLFYFIYLFIIYYFLLLFFFFVCLLFAFLIRKAKTKTKNKNSVK